MKTRRREAHRRQAHPGLFITEIDGRQIGWSRATPVAPEEQRWLDEACALALAASLEIHGEHADTQLIDIGVIGRAAEQVWSAMPGAPRWCLLDVDALLARLEREMPGGELRDNFVATLMTFVYWLANHRHISRQDHLALRARIEPYLPEIFFSMGYEPIALSASLRPC